MTLSPSPHDATADGRTRPWVIGITGPIASGKSTAAAMMKELGADVIDADLVYRSLLTPGSSLQADIVSRFGPSILGASGEIDRQALGTIVFNDAEGLADLESLTHPAVVAEIRRRIGTSHANVVVVEAIKLSQAGLLPDLDSLWFITADEEYRLARLRARNGLTPDEARARIAGSSSVLPCEDHADVIIRNSGDMSFLYGAVAKAWQSTIHHVGDVPRNATTASAVKGESN